MASSKAAVGVGWQIKALSMHIQKPYKRNNCLSSHSYHFVIFFSTRLLHAYGQYFYIVKEKYQIAPLKAVVGVDRPMKAPSMHIQKPY